MCNDNANSRLMLDALQILQLTLQYRVLDYDRIEYLEMSHVGVTCHDNL